MSYVKNLDINGTSYPIKSVAVNDVNSGSAIKTWTGTKAQYDAITTKDANTLYNITDDTDVTLSLLELLYPVGSIYIGTMNACPLAALGVGTWQLVASDRVLQGAGTRGNVGDTLNESLPNITGSIRSGMVTKNANTSTAASSEVVATGAFSGYSVGSNAVFSSTTNASWFLTGGWDIDASNSSSTYQDNAPVQQNAYLVNIWERIS